MNRALLLPVLLALGIAAGASPVHAKAKDRHSRKASAARGAPQPDAASESEAELRLVEVYRLIVDANSREALDKASALVRDHPNFQLAQLVYGDLLLLRARPVSSVGEVPPGAAPPATEALAELREQARLRIRAFTQRPPANTVPSQFLQLSPGNKHAIAIDTSRARLYLFENTPVGAKLVADFYVSLGKLGIDKETEGDSRTPLGVYFVQSNLDPRSLKQFYGAGALPLNYPNPFDVRRGKSGKGIWLHGSPPQEFARAPKATDGCVVLSNPDLRKIISTVEIRTTPVVIAPSLTWVAPQALAPRAKQFGEVIEAWHSARQSGDAVRLLDFYARDFNAQGKTLDVLTSEIKSELAATHGRKVLLDDVSYLKWSDALDTMVVTFREGVEGRGVARIKRQYWMRDGTRWKIFFEGVIG